jgi:hypothetical protein
MGRTEENLTSADGSALPDDNDEPTKANDSPSFERAESNKGDTTAIDKGPYGAVAILTIDGNFLRSLGFNPEHVDEIRYRPYNGAVLVEPVAS